MNRKTIYASVGAAAALCVPALVAAQRVNFTDNERLTAAQLDNLSQGADVARAARCRVAAQNPCGGASCTATCPAGHVVMGGGCTMNGAGTIKTVAPGFDPATATTTFNGFPAAAGFNAAAADPVTDFGDALATSVGVTNTNADSPEWDRYGCQAATGTVQTVYAICCPL